MDAWKFAINPCIALYTPPPPCGATDLCIRVQELVSLVSLSPQLSSGWGPHGAAQAQSVCPLPEPGQHQHSRLNNRAVPQSCLKLKSSSKIKCQIWECVTEVRMGVIRKTWVLMRFLYLLVEWMSLNGGSDAKWFMVEIKLTSHFEDDKNVPKQIWF